MISESRATKVEASAFGVPSLTISFVWTLAASAAYSGSQWLTIVLFAKRGTSAVVGQYAFATAVAYPVSLLANLQLRSVFVTDLKGRFSFGNMLGLRYLLVGFASLLLFGISFWNRSDVQTFALILLVGASLLIDAASESYYSILQVNERMDRIARSQILRSSLSLAALGFSLYYGQGVVWAAGGMLCAKLCVLFAYDSVGRLLVDGLSRREGVNRTRADLFLPTWDSDIESDLFRTALPLGAVSIVGSVAGYMPRYIIQHYLGPAELGIYSALGYIPQLAVMVAVAIGAVTFARMSRSFGEGQIATFLGLLRTSLLICAGLGATALLVSGLMGREILRVLYRPEYAAHWGLLMWLVAAGAIACFATCLGCAMTAASQFRPQIPLLFVVIVVSAGATILLVPRLHLTGAAVASLLAMIVQLGGASLVLHKAVRIRAAAVLHERSQASNNYACV